jgi:2-dehydro-3-deoxygluconokinase
VELVMRIFVLGEGMIELSRRGDLWELGYGGDTLNTAIHLARFGWDVSFISALGTDPFSEGLRGDWAAEGLDTSLILSDPARRPGLYAIQTDAAGERSFHYWRENSAVRGLFGLPGIETVIAAVEVADLFYFSLISLAVLPPDAREQLFELCRRLRRRGGRVVFDGNYRPLLWSSQAEALRVRETALTVTDIGFPTFEDEVALGGFASAAEVAAAWRAGGVGEVLVKMGRDGCLLPDGRILPPTMTITPLDSSGAGDSFNAGYLQARLAGADEATAAAAGHRLAQWVIGRKGAIPARDDPDVYRPFGLGPTP